MPGPVRRLLPSVAATLDRPMRCKIPGQRPGPIKFCHVIANPDLLFVFVRLTDKFKVDDQRTAVWVSGEIETKASHKALTLTDVTADVAVGYHIDGGSAEICRD